MLVDGLNCDVTVYHVQKINDLMGFNKCNRLLEFSNNRFEIVGCFSGGLFNKA